MTRILSAILIASLAVTGPTLGDTSQGSGAPMPLATEGTNWYGNTPAYAPQVAAQPVACRPETDTVQAPTCGPVAGTSWQAFPPVTNSADELAAQERANAEWRREQLNRAQDGIEHGNLPVGFATQYWNGATGAKTGGDWGRPVGASID
jgi:hypothetical protein